MDGEERKKKLQAGKERLAAFQKKKGRKKHRKAETPSVEDGSDQPDTLTLSGTESAELSVNSDIQSFSYEESDEGSLVASDLSGDDTSNVDISFEAKVELKHAADEITLLEEQLFGKQAAIDDLSQENEKLREQLSSQSLDVSSNLSSDSTSVPHDQEDQQKKVKEFELALAQRDDVLKQLSDSLLVEKQSRNSVEEAYSTQTEQLTRQIHQLQGQMHKAGETLQEQTEKQGQTAETLLTAKTQIVNLQETLHEKDATLKLLTSKFTDNLEELLNVQEENEQLQKSESEARTAAEQLKKSEAVARASADRLQNQLQALEESSEELVNAQVEFEQLKKSEANAKLNVERLQSELQTFKRENRQLVNSHSVLEKSEATAKATANELKTKLEVLQENNKDLVHQQEQLKQSEAEACAVSADLRSKFELLQETNENLVRKQDQLIQGEAEAKASAEKLQTEFQSLQETFEVLTKSSNEQLAQINLLKTGIDSVTQNVSVIDGEAGRVLAKDSLVANVPMKSVSDLVHEEEVTPSHLQSEESSFYQNDIFSGLKDETLVQPVQNDGSVESVFVPSLETKEMLPVKQAKGASPDQDLLHLIEQFETKPDSMSPLVHEEEVIPVEVQTEEVSIDPSTLFDVEKNAPISQTQEHFSLKTDSELSSTPVNEEAIIPIEMQNEETSLGQEIMLGEEPMVVAEMNESDLRTEPSQEPSPSHEAVLVEEQSSDANADQGGPIEPTGHPVKTVSLSDYFSPVKEDKNTDVNHAKATSINEKSDISDGMEKELVSQAQVAPRESLPSNYFSPVKEDKVADVKLVEATPLDEERDINDGVEMELVSQVEVAPEESLPSDSTDSTLQSGASLLPVDGSEEVAMSHLEEIRTLKELLSAARVEKDCEINRLEEECTLLKEKLSSNGGEGNEGARISEDVLPRHSGALIDVDELNDKSLPDVNVQSEVPEQGLNLGSFGASDEAAEFTEKNAELVKINEMVENRCVELEDGMQCLREECQELKKFNTDLEQGKEALDSQCNDVNEKYKKAVQSLSDLKNLCSDLERNCDVLIEKGRSLEKEKSQLDECCDELCEKCNVVETECKRLEHELECRTKEYEADRCQLKTQLDESYTRSQDFVTKCLGLEQTNNDLEIRCNDLDTKLSEVTEEHMSVQKHSDEKETEVVSLKAQMSELTDKLSLINQDLLNYDREQEIINEKDLLIQSLEDEISDLSVNFSAEREKVERVVSELQMTDEGMNKNLKEKEDELESLRAQVAQKTAEVMNKEFEVGKLAQELQNVKDSCNSLVRDKDRQLDSLNYEINGLSGVLSGKDNQVEMLSQDLQVSEKRFAGMLNERDMLVQSLRESIANLSSDLSEKSDHNRLLSEKLMEQEEGCSQLKLEMDRLQGRSLEEAKELTGLLGDKDQEIERLREEAAKRWDALQEKQSAIEKGEVTAKSLNDEIVHYRGQLERLFQGEQTQIERQKELEKLLEEVSILKQELHGKDCQVAEDGRVIEKLGKDAEKDKVKKAKEARHLQGQLAKSAATNERLINQAAVLDERLQVEERKKSELEHSLSTEIADLKAHLNEIEMKMSEDAKTIENLRKTTEVVEEFEKLTKKELDGQNEVERLTMEVQALHKSVIEKEYRISEGMSVIEKLGKDLDVERKQVLQQTNEVQKLMDEVRATKFALQNKDLAIGSHQESIAILQTEKEQMLQILNQERQQNEQLSGLVSQEQNKNQYLSNMLSKEQNQNQANLQEIRMLQSHLDHSLDEYSHAQKEIQHYQSQIERLLTEKDTDKLLNSEVEKLRGDVSDYKEKLSGQRTGNESILQELGNLKVERDGYKQKLDQVLYEKDRLSNELGGEVLSLKKEIDHYQHDCSDLLERMSKLNESHTHEIAMLNDQILGRNDDIAKMRTALEGWSKTFHAMQYNAEQATNALQQRDSYIQQQADQMQQQGATLQAHSSQIESSIQHIQWLEGERDGLNSQIKELDQKNLFLNDEVEKLQTNIQALYVQLDRFGKEASSPRFQMQAEMYDDRIKDMIFQLQHKNICIESVEGEKMKLCDELKAERLKVKAHQEMVSALLKSTADQKAQIKLLQSKVKDLKAEKEQVNSSRLRSESIEAALRAELEKPQTEVETLSDDILLTNLQAEVSNLKLDKQTANATLQAVEIERNHLRSEVQRLHTELERQKPDVLVVEELILPLEVVPVVAGLFEPDDTNTMMSLADAPGAIVEDQPILQSKRAKVEEAAQNLIAIMNEETIRESDAILQVPCQEIVSEDEIVPSETAPVDSAINSTLAIISPLSQSHSDALTKPNSSSEDAIVEETPSCTEISPVSLFPVPLCDSSEVDSTSAISDNSSKLYTLSEHTFQDPLPHHSRNIMLIGNLGAEVEKLKKEKLRLEDILTNERSVRVAEMVTSNAKIQLLVKDNDAFQMNMAMLKDRSRGDQRKQEEMERRAKGLEFEKNNAIALLKGQGLEELLKYRMLVESLGSEVEKLRQEKQHLVQGAAQEEAESLDAYELNIAMVKELLHETKKENSDLKSQLTGLEFEKWNSESILSIEARKQKAETEKFKMLAQSFSSELEKWKGDRNASRELSIQEHAGAIVSDAVHDAQVTVLRDELSIYNDNLLLLKSVIEQGKSENSGLRSKLNLLESTLKDTENRESILKELNQALHAECDCLKQNLDEVTEKGQDVVSDLITKQLLCNAELRLTNTDLDAYKLNLAKIKDLLEQSETQRSRLQRVLNEEIRKQEGMAITHKTKMLLVATETEETALMKKSESQAEISKLKMLLENLSSEHERLKQHTHNIECSSQKMVAELIAEAVVAVSQLQLELADVDAYKLNLAKLKQLLSEAESQRTHMEQALQMQNDRLNGIECESQEQIEKLSHECEHFKEQLDQQNERSQDMVVDLITKQTLSCAELQLAYTDLEAYKLNLAKLKDLLEQSEAQRSRMQLAINDEIRKQDGMAIKHETSMTLVASESEARVCSIESKSRAEITKFKMLLENLSSEHERLKHQTHDMEGSAQKLVAELISEAVVAVSHLRLESADVDSYKLNLAMLKQLLSDIEKERKQLEGTLKEQIGKCEGLEFLSKEQDENLQRLESECSELKTRLDVQNEKAQDMVSDFITEQTISKAELQPANNDLDAYKLNLAEVKDLLDQSEAQRCHLQCVLNEEIRKQDGMVIKHETSMSVLASETKAEITKLKMLLENLSSEHEKLKQHRNNVESSAQRMVAELIAEAVVAVSQLQLELADVDAYKLNLAKLKQLLSDAESQRTHMVQALQMQNDRLNGIECESREQIEKLSHECEHLKEQLDQQNERSQDMVVDLITKQTLSCAELQLVYTDLEAYKLNLAKLKDLLEQSEAQRSRMQLAINDEIRKQDGMAIKHETSMTLVASESEARVCSIESKSRAEITKLKMLLENLSSEHERLKHQTRNMEGSAQKLVAELIAEAVVAVSHLKLELADVDAYKLNLAKLKQLLSDSERERKEIEKSLEKEMRRGVELELEKAADIASVSHKSDEEIARFKMFVESLGSECEKLKHQLKSQDESAQCSIAEVYAEGVVMSAHLRLLEADIGSYKLNLAKMKELLDRSMVEGDRKAFEKDSKIFSLQEELDKQSSHPKKRVASFQDDICEKQTDMEQLQADLDSKGDEIESLQSEIEKLRSENDTLKKSFMSVSQELVESKSTLGNEVEIYKTKAIDLEESVFELQCQDESHQQRLAGVEKELESQKLEKEIIQSEPDELRRMVVALKEENHLLQEDVNKLHQEQEKILHTLRNDADVVTVQVQELKQKNEEFEKALESSQKMEKTASAELHILKAERESLQRSADSEKTNEQQSELEQLRTDLERQRTVEKVQDLQTESNSLRDKCSQLQNESECKDSKIAELETKLEDFAEQIRKLYQQVNKYVGKTSDLNSQIIDIKTERDATEKSCKDEVNRQQQLLNQAEEKMQQILNEQKEVLKVVLQEKEGLLVQLDKATMEKKHIEEELSKACTARDEYANSLGIQVERLEIENENLKSLLENSKEDNIQGIKDLIAENGTLLTKVNDLEDKNKSLEKNCSEYLQSNGSLQDETISQKLAIEKQDELLGEMSQQMNELCTVNSANEDLSLKLETSLNSKEKELIDLQKEHDNLKHDLNVREGCMEDLLGQLNAAKIENERKANDLQDLEEDFSSLKEENEAIQLQLKSFEDLKVKVDALEKEGEKSVLDTLESEKKFNARIDHFSKQLDESANEKELLRSYLSVATAKGDEYAKALDSLSGQVSRFDAEVERLETENRNLKSVMENSKEDNVKKIEELIGLNDELSDKVSSLEGTIDKLKMNCEEYLQSCNDLQEENMSQKLEIEGEQVAHKVMSERLADAQNENLNLASEVQLLKAALLSKDTELVSQAEQVNELREQLSGLNVVNEKNQTLENDYNALEEDLSAKEKDLTTLQERLDEVVDSIQARGELSDEILQLQQKLDDLETIKVENDLFKTELDSLRKELADFECLKADEEARLDETSTTELQHLKEEREKLVSQVDELLQICDKYKEHEIDYDASKHSKEIEIEQLRAEIAYLSGGLQTLEGEKKVLEDMCDVLERQHQIEETKLLGESDLQEAYEDLVNKLVAVEKENKELEEMSHNLKNLCAGFKDENVGLRQSLDEGAANISRLEANLRDFEKEFDHAQDEFDGEVQQMKDKMRLEVDSMQSGYEQALENVRRTMDSDKVSLLKTHEEKVEALSKEYDGEMEKTRNKLEDYQTEKKSIEANVIDLQDQRRKMIDDMITTREELNTLKTDFEKDLSAAAVRYEQAQLENTALQDNYADLGTLIEDMRANHEETCKSLRKELEAKSESEKAHLREDLRKYEVEVSNLHSGLESSLLPEDMYILRTEHERYVADQKANYEAIVCGYDAALTNLNEEHAEEVARLKAEAGQESEALSLDIGENIIPEEVIAQLEVHPYVDFEPEVVGSLESVEDFLSYRQSEDVDTEPSEVVISPDVFEALSSVPDESLSEEIIPEVSEVISAQPEPNGPQLQSHLQELEEQVVVEQVMAAFSEVPETLTLSDFTSENNDDDQTQSDADDILLQEELTESDCLIEQFGDSLKDNETEETVKNEDLEKQVESLRIDLHDLQKECEQLIEEKDSLKVQCEQDLKNLQNEHDTEIQRLKDLVYEYDEIKEKQIEELNSKHFQELEELRFELMQENEQIETMKESSLEELLIQERQIRDQYQEQLEEVRLELNIRSEEQKQAVEELNEEIEFLKAENDKFQADVLYGEERIKHLDRLLGDFKGENCEDYAPWEEELQAGEELARSLSPHAEFSSKSILQEVYDLEGVPDSPATPIPGDEIWGLVNKEGASEERNVTDDDALRNDLLQDKIRDLETKHQFEMKQLTEHLKDMAEIEKMRLRAEIELELRDEKRQYKEKLDYELKMQLRGMKQEQEMKFIEELQRSRSELMRKQDDKIDAIRKKFNEQSLHQMTVESTDELEEVVQRLQTENQDLLETRHVLLEQLDHALFLKEAQQEQILSVNADKEHLEEKILKLQAELRKYTGESSIEQAAELDKDEWRIMYDGLLSERLKSGVSQEPSVEQPVGIPLSQAHWQRKTPPLTDTPVWDMTGISGGMPSSPKQAHVPVWEWTATDDFEAMHQSPRLERLPNSELTDLSIPKSPRTTEIPDSQILPGMSNKSETDTQQLVSPLPQNTGGNFCFEEDLNSVYEPSFDVPDKEIMSVGPDKPQNVLHEQILGLQEKEIGYSPVEDKEKQEFRGSRKRSLNSPPKPDGEYIYENEADAPVSVDDEGQYITEISQTDDDLVSGSQVEHKEGEYISESPIDVVKLRDNMFKYARENEALRSEIGALLSNRDSPAVSALKTQVQDLKDENDSLRSEISNDTPDGIKHETLEQKYADVCEELKRLKVSVHGPALESTNDGFRMDDDVHVGFVPDGNDSTDKIMLSPPASASVGANEGFSMDVDEEAGFIPDVDEVALAAEVEYPKSDPEPKTEGTPSADICETGFIPEFDDSLDEIGGNEKMQSEAASTVDSVFVPDIEANDEQVPDMEPYAVLEAKYTDACQELEKLKEQLAHLEPEVGLLAEKDSFVPDIESMVDNDAIQLSAELKPQTDLQNDTTDLVNAGDTGYSSFAPDAGVGTLDEKVKKSEKPIVPKESSEMERRGKSETDFEHLKENFLKQQSEFDKYKDDASKTYEELLNAKTELDEVVTKQNIELLDLEGLRQKCVNLDEANAELIEEINGNEKDFSKQISELEKEILLFETNREDLQETNDQLNVEVEDLKEKNDELRRQTRTLAEELGKVCDQNIILQRELDGWATLQEPANPDHIFWPIAGEALAIDEMEFGPSHESSGFEVSGKETSGSAMETVSEESRQEHEASSAEVEDKVLSVTDDHASFSHPCHEEQILPTSVVDEEAAVRLQSDFVLPQNIDEEILSSAPQDELDIDVKLPVADIEWSVAGIQEDNASQVNLSTPLKEAMEEPGVREDKVTQVIVESVILEDKATQVIISTPLKDTIEKSGIQTDKATQVIISTPLNETLEESQEVSDLFFTPNRSTLLEDTFATAMDTPRSMDSLGRFSLGGHSDSTGELLAANCMPDLGKSLTDKELSASLQKLAVECDSYKTKQKALEEHLSRCNSPVHEPPSDELFEDTKYFKEVIASLKDEKVELRCLNEGFKDITDQLKKKIAKLLKKNDDLEIKNMNLEVECESLRTRVNEMEIELDKYFKNNNKLTKKNKDLSAKCDRFESLLAGRLSEMKKPKVQDTSARKGRFSPPKRPSNNTEVIAKGKQEESLSPSPKREIKKELFSAWPTKEVPREVSPVNRHIARSLPVGDRDKTQAIPTLPFDEDDKFKLTERWVSEHSLNSPTEDHGEIAQDTSKKHLDGAEDKYQKDMTRLENDLKHYEDKLSKRDLEKVEASPKPVTQEPQVVASPSRFYEELSQLQRVFKETKDAYSDMSGENTRLKTLLEHERYSHLSDMSRSSIGALTPHQKLSPHSDVSRSDTTPHYNYPADYLALREKVARLQNSNDDLTSQLNNQSFRLHDQEKVVQDLKSHLNSSDIVTSEVQQVFTHQLAMLQTQRDFLERKVQEQRGKDKELAEVMGDKLILEENLRREKELLRQIVHEKEMQEVDLIRARSMVDEKERSHRRLQNLLQEKDRYEADLVKQKQTLQDELSSIEGSLISRSGRNRLERDSALSDWQAPKGPHQRTSTPAKDPVSLNSTIQSQSAVGDMVHSAAGDLDYQHSLLSIDSTRSDRETLRRLQRLRLESELCSDLALGRLKGRYDAVRLNKEHTTDVLKWRKSRRPNNAYSSF